jgi:uncharacterized protein (TIRG00374 family)
MNMTEGLASLIASRVYDFFIILLILIFASIGFQGLFKDNSFLIILLACLLIVLIFLTFFYMSRFLRWLSNLLVRISRWTQLGDEKTFSWVRRKMNEIAEDFYAIKARKNYVSVVLTSLVSWFMIFWTFYAYMKGFGVNLSFIKMLLGSTMGVITNALPISGIGNWGTLEVGWTAGFLMIGLSKEKAITTGFGVHIVIFILCLFISFICWVTSKKQ